MSVDFQMRMKFSSHILPTTYNLMQAAGVRYCGRRDMIWDSSRLPVLENTWSLEYIQSQSIHGLQSIQSQSLHGVQSILYLCTLYPVMFSMQEYTVSICTLYLVMFSVIYRVSICTLYPVMFSLIHCIYLYLVSCNVQHAGIHCIYLYLVSCNVKWETLYLSVPCIL